MASPRLNRRLGAAVAVAAVAAALAPATAPGGLIGGDTQLIIGQGTTGQGSTYNIDIRRSSTGGLLGSATFNHSTAGERSGPAVCVKIDAAGNRGVFGIADTENGRTRYIRFYVEDTAAGKRIIQLGGSRTPPPDDCQANLPSPKTGNLITPGSTLVINPDPGDGGGGAT